METTITTSQGNVVIRQAGEQDAAAYRELRLEALRNHPEAFSADYAWNASRPLGFWQERLRGGSPEVLWAIYMALHDGQGLGIGGIVCENSPKLRHGGLIVGMYVQPAWRGLHVAEALVTACLEWAGAHEMTIVKLGVATSNVPAIRCYARCGFQVYGVDPKVLRLPDGTVYDELLMARAL